MKTIGTQSASHSRMKTYAWSSEKNQRLKEERGISFEEIVRSSCSISSYPRDLNATRTDLTGFSLLPLRRSPLLSHWLDITVSRVCNSSYKKSLPVGYTKEPTLGDFDIRQVPTRSRHSRRGTGRPQSDADRPYGSCIRSDAIPPGLQTALSPGLIASGGRPTGRQ